MTAVVTPVSRAILFPNPEARLIVAENSTMGRKKSDKPGSPPRPHAVVVKGTLEWKEWIENAAEHCRTNVSSLVDIAVTQYVRAQGYEVKPPPR
jgi:hypothetical protein